VFERQCFQTSTLIHDIGEKNDMHMYVLWSSMSSEPHVSFGEILQALDMHVIHETAFLATRLSAHKVLNGNPYVPYT
jgi:hypothetical protein